MKKEFIWNLCLLFVGCSLAFFKLYPMFLGGINSYNLNRTIGWSNPYKEAITAIFGVGFSFGIVLIAFRYIFIVIFRWFKKNL
jgi:hypothetical protein